MRIYVEELMSDITKKKANLKEANASLKGIKTSLLDITKAVHNLKYLAESKPSPFLKQSLNKSILKTLKSLEKVFSTQEIQVYEQLSGDPLEFWTNSDKLNQLCVNLLMNAKDALLKNSAGDRVIIINSGKRGKDTVWLEVSDNGEGISPENLRHIFTPYFTTKAEGSGTGLGLAIVQKILNEHKATIEVESKLNEGTRIRVFFPVDRRHKARSTK